MNEHIVKPDTDGGKILATKPSTPLVADAEAALQRAERAGTTLYDRRRDLAVIHLDPFRRFRIRATPRTPSWPVCGGPCAPSATAAAPVTGPMI